MLMRCYLLHVLGNAVFAQELFRLHLVVDFCGCNEGLLEVLTVDLEGGLLGIVLVQAQ